MDVWSLTRCWHYWLKGFFVCNWLNSKIYSVKFCLKCLQPCVMELTQSMLVFVLGKGMGHKSQWHFFIYYIVESVIWLPRTSYSHQSGQLLTIRLFNHDTQSLWNGENYFPNTSSPVPFFFGQIAWLSACCGIIYDLTGWESVFFWWSIKSGALSVS